MMWWYNTGIAAYTAGVRLAAHGNDKARAWCEGRRNLFARLGEAMKGERDVVWIHVSSLGEFEQGRPVIEAIRREHPRYKILLTFFSPSGYLIRKNYEAVDWVFYLPADSPRNVRRFLDCVPCRVAIFVKYDYWLNYLRELKRRGIRTYIFSALFRPRSAFFRPWGGAFRRALSTFELIFVQNEESRRLLSGIGYDNVVVAGDTRFDRAAMLPATAGRFPVVERFRGQGRLFLAGSTWKPDEELLIPFINAHPDIRFVVAPHEMEESRIAHLIASVRGGALRYSECTEQTDPHEAHLLIIDTIGILNQLYQYAHWAYIGGGFGVCIHNTQEPATYGMPIAFGPKYGKFKEACDMIALGACRSVSTTEELEAWFAPLAADESLRRRLARTASDYIARNCGATSLIVHTLFAEEKTPAPGRP